MLWLKLLLAGVSIGFCVLLGYLAANKYRSRQKFYEQFYHFNECYLNELGYARKPLPQFLAEHEFTGDFKKTIDAFIAGKDDKVLHSFLSDEERKECAEYFSMLGRGDALSQSGFFSARRAALEQKKADTEKEARARGALYLKLGLLAGLAFVILII